MTVDEVKKYLGTLPEFNGVDLSYINRELLQDRKDAWLAPINEEPGALSQVYANHFVPDPENWTWYVGFDPQSCQRSQLYIIKASQGISAKKLGKCPQGYDRWSIQYNAG